MSGPRAVLVLAIALFLIYLPVNVEFQIGTAGDFPIHLFYFDFAAAFVALAHIPAMARSIRRRSLPFPLVALGGVALLLVIALAVHPSASGAVMTARFVCIVFVAFALSRAREEQEMAAIISIALGTAAAVAAVAVAQSLNQATVGLDVLGEEPLAYTFGPYRGAQAMFGHPYILAAYSLTAVGIASWSSLRNSRLALVAAGAVAVPIGLTYSRTSAVAVAAIVITAIVSIRRADGKRLALVTGIVLVAIAVPALLTLEGWSYKVSSRLPAEDDAGAVEVTDTLTSGRLRFTRQALILIGNDPLTGVGPGRYGHAISETPEAASLGEALEVHTWPLFIAAEAGVAAGLLAVAVLVSLGRRALRTGPGPTILFVAFLPFLLLDTVASIHAPGVGLLGIWVGFLVVMTRADVPPGPPAP